MWLNWESLGLASALLDEAENWPMNWPRLLLCWRMQLLITKPEIMKKKIIAMHAMGTWVEKLKLSKLTH